MTITRSKSGVCCTDQAKPAQVRLTQQHRKISDALAVPGVEDIDFEPPRVDIESRLADPG